MYYLLLFILIVALWPIIVVLIGILLLIGTWGWWKIMNFINWLKVLCFRAFAMGGNCAVTVLVAIGLCSPEMIPKKDSEKSHSNQEKA